MSLRTRIHSDVDALIHRHATRDPRVILEERGVVLGDFSGEASLLGMYRSILGTRFVYWNHRLSVPLQRMVLAHELGHDIYHGDTEFSLHTPPSLVTGREELEANIFAAHLLIPDEDALEMAEEGFTCAQMASAFMVDERLMALKLNELHRMGLGIRSVEDPDVQFFSKIDGRDQSNWDIL